MENTLLDQFDGIIDHCFRLFQDKNEDYGPAWLLYRYPSLNDEIWRKAKRIRTLEEHSDMARIPEGRDVEYVGIINYCIMFLIKLEPPEGIPAGDALAEELTLLDSVSGEAIFRAYQAQAALAREVLAEKNTDYGDAWKSMSLGSMTDQIIIRVYRIRKLLRNQGKSRVSEGIASQLRDIINYCVFALVKMDAAPPALTKL